MIVSLGQNSSAFVEVFVENYEERRGGSVLCPILCKMCANDGWPK